MTPRTFEYTLPERLHQFREPAAAVPGSLPSAAVLRALPDLRLSFCQPWRITEPRILLKSVPRAFDHHLNGGHRAEDLLAHLYCGARLRGLVRLGPADSG